MGPKVQRTHVLERTSPKGEAFFGKCVLCGGEGFAASAALEPCLNPHEVSDIDALMYTLEGTWDEFNEAKPALN